MFEISWIVFLAASLLVIISPGEDMVLVFSRGLGQGASAGVATAAGVSTGLLGHTALAALGLGAILKTSATLFLILKFIGAAYLIYLGVRTSARRRIASERPCIARQIAAAAVPRRRSIEPVEPEGRGVLLRIPAAVRAGGRGRTRRRRFLFSAWCLPR